MLRRSNVNVEKLSVKDLIEVALQLDLDMFKHLPEGWKNPGAAGLCAFRVIADELSAVKSELSDDVKKFLENIDLVTTKAVQKIKADPGAFIKADINDLYEYAGGFQRTVYSDDRYQSYKKGLEEAKLPQEGQLVYRIRDGRFFVLVHPGFIDEIQKIYGNKERPTSEMRNAHFTINDGMSKQESEKIYKAMQELGECKEPLFNAGIEGIVSLNKSIKFSVVGAYEGIVKTSARFAHTQQLTVISEDLDQLKIAYGLTYKLKDFWFHITFAENLRKVHPSLDKIGLITAELSSENEISKLVKDVLSVAPTLAVASVRKDGLFAESKSDKTVDVIDKALIKLSL